MGTRDHDNPDVARGTAYANRLLLLNLVEVLEMRGATGLLTQLANGISQSIGKESTSRVDAIFGLAEDLDAIADRIGRGETYADKRSR